MPSDSRSGCERQTIQKPKGSLPVLIRFRSEPSGKDRYVLTDIPLGTLQEMHERFMSETGGTAEEFVSYVHDSLGKDSPRIFRDVDYLPL